MQAMKRFYRLRVSRQQAMQLDTSENNPLEMLSTDMLMSLTRRIDDFPAFFDKHDESGDGKLQRGEFASVIRDMGLSLNKAQMTELYFVLEGEGSVMLDGEERAVRKGSMVHIPPGVVHGAVGKMRVLVVGIPDIDDSDVYYV